MRKILFGFAAAASLAVGPYVASAESRTLRAEELQPGAVIESDFLGIACSVEEVAEYLYQAGGLIGYVFQRMEERNEADPESWARALSAPPPAELEATLDVYMNGLRRSTPSNNLRLTPEMEESYRKWATAALVYFYREHGSGMDVALTEEQVEMILDKAVLHAFIWMTGVGPVRAALNGGFCEPVENLSISTTELQYQQVRYYFNTANWSVALLEMSLNFDEPVSTTPQANKFRLTASASVPVFVVAVVQKGFSDTSDTPSSAGDRGSKQAKIRAFCGDPPSEGAAQTCREHGVTPAHNGPRVTWELYNKMSLCIGPGGASFWTKSENRHLSVGDGCEPVWKRHICDDPWASPAEKRRCSELGLWEER